MRRPLSGLILLIALVVCVPVSGQGLVFELFGSYLEALRVQAGIPGLSVAVVGSSDILWERGFGVHDVDAAEPTRTDTPFHMAGLTQIVTTGVVLRCVEEGRLSLDDPVSAFVDPGHPDGHLRLQELLSHSSPGADGPVFDYRPDRLGPLANAIEACTGEPFRKTVGDLFDRIGSVDSVPGPDVVLLPPTPTYTPATARYQAILDRMATPYWVDGEGRPVRSEYPKTTLTAASGLVSSVRDWARFDIELRTGVILQPDTLALAWRPPTGGDGEPLAHGLGWFVQRYNGELVGWQYGVVVNASSALVVMVPNRGLTVTLLANSDRLAAPFNVAPGDLTLSPFGRLVLELFVP